MARQRIIRPEFFTDEMLALLSPHARLLFAGLWCLADKRGRLRDQSAVIHGAVFPFEPKLDVGSLLDDLQESGSIIRYKVEGKKYIQVKNFERFQNPHPKEAESSIPAVPPHYVAEPRKETAEPRKETAEPGLTSFLRSFTPSDTDNISLASTAEPCNSTAPASKESSSSADALAKLPIQPDVLSWSREACDDWIERFGGTAPGGQIGKFLKPLVKRHGWPVVRSAWRSYLAQSEAQYASPSRFSGTFGKWAGLIEDPEKPDEVMAHNERFLKGVVDRMQSQGRELGNVAGLLPSMPKARR